MLRLAVLMDDFQTPTISKISFRWLRAFERGHTKSHHHNENTVSRLSTWSRNRRCYIILVMATCSIISNRRERGDPLGYGSVSVGATSSPMPSYHYWAILSLLPRLST